MGRLTKRLTKGQRAALTQRYSRDDGDRENPYNRPAPPISLPQLRCLSHPLVPDREIASAFDKRPTPRQRRQER
jgi:hypothetical protein